MIRIIYNAPGLLFSSDVPDIQISTDHDFVDVRLRCDTLELLSERFYAVQGIVTIRDVAPLINQVYHNDIDYDIAEVTIEASAGNETVQPVSFSTIYCNRETDLYNPAEWLAENFLTSVSSRRIAPDGWLRLSWYARKQESIAVSVQITYLDDDGHRQTFRWLHSGNNQSATADGILSVYIRVEEILEALMEYGMDNHPSILLFTVQCGHRMTTYFIDRELTDAQMFDFTNCFNRQEQLQLKCVTTAKIKKDHTIATLGREAQFYDVILSKEYETQTAPLTSDECELMEQMLTANYVRIWYRKGENNKRGPFSVKQILITDFTSEISNGDDKLNSVKFTWRFVHNLPGIALSDTPGIFNDTFNPIYS